MRLYPPLLFFPSGCAKELHVSESHCSARYGRCGKTILGMGKMKRPAHGFGQSASLRHKHLEEEGGEKKGAEFRGDDEPVSWWLAWR